MSRENSIPSRNKPPASSSATTTVKNVYYAEEPGRRSAAKLFTRDEARRKRTTLLQMARTGLKLAEREQIENTAPSGPVRLTPEAWPSDKLAQGGGVICSPNVDPGIKVPAPETGKMPVIPPPGLPGGDPNVKPK